MRLICVANSWRPDGRCVAGVDVDTGELIRPVGASADAIPVDRLDIDGAMLTVGDIFELETTRPPVVTRYQRENRTIVDWNWRRVGKVPSRSLLSYCEDPAPLFHTTSERVLPILLDKLPAEEWRSLVLLQPRRLRFERDGYDAQRWRARFEDRAGNEYFLRVTDPVATQKLSAGQPISRHTILLVSLTRPWMPRDASKLELCYKIVATVIEF
jgi:hypothetical protein